MSRRLVFAALIVTVVAATAGFYAARGHRTDRASGPRGYVGSDTSGAVFVAWTEAKDGNLVGSVETVNADDTRHEVDAVTLSMTGVRRGSMVSLTLHGDLGTTQTWNGTFHGASLTLDIPQSDGSIAPIVLRPGTSADYNNAADALRAEVAGDKQRAERARAVAEQEQRSAAHTAADQQAPEAAQAAARLLAEWRGTCAAHGGTTSADEPTGQLNYKTQGPDSANEYCVVTFGTEGIFEVPLNRDDGTFDQSTADGNKALCDGDAADASADAQNGYAWARQPEYHAAAGVCYRGQRRAS